MNRQMGQEQDAQNSRITYFACHDLEIDNDVNIYEQQLFYSDFDVKHFELINELNLIQLAVSVS